MLDKGDYAVIHDIVFQPNYPGYKPTIVESPDGDGVLDHGKRYAHIAYKYLAEYYDAGNKLILESYLNRAHNLALEAAYAMGVPEEYMPDINRGALRILEYPPGAVTNPHCDFNLFTLMMYRDQPEHFEYVSGEPSTQLQEINHQIHYGEITELLGLGYATRHKVTASDTTQHSIVYFNVPRWEVKLPDGRTVEEFIVERTARSRYNVD